jgi:hypothetical protein
MARGVAISPDARPRERSHKANPTAKRYSIERTAHLAHHERSTPGSQQAKAMPSTADRASLFPIAIHTRPNVHVHTRHQPMPQYKTHSRVWKELSRREGGGESFITRPRRSSSSSWRVPRQRLPSSGAQQSACSTLLGPTQSRRGREDRVHHQPGDHISKTAGCGR